MADELREHMRIRKTIWILILIVFLIRGGNLTSSSQERDTDPKVPSEIHIAPHVVLMPLERIILVRKDSDYCAIKFNRFWGGQKTDQDWYAEYESYYQDDKTGDFTKDKVKFRKDVLSSPKAKWSLFGHPVVLFGVNKEIKCGPIRLWWTGKGSVYFFKRYQPEGDYGIELAPTPWSNISEVNVFDPRIKWYRYDEKREKVNILINQLWE